MLLIFDVLMIDDESFIHRRFSVRRTRLRRILPKDEQLHGRCEVVESKILRFSTEPEKARQELIDECVMGWAQKWEGFVLKARCSPYTDLSYKRDKSSRGFGWVAGRNAWIKFKRDYIAGYGDTADFCVVGGRAERGTDARVGKAPAGLDPDALRIFHAAVIMNKEGAKKGEKPRLRVLFEVRYSIPKEDLAWIQRVNTFRGEDYKVTLIRFIRNNELINSGPDRNDEVRPRISARTLHHQTRQDICYAYSL
jgi:DNA ligase-4